jgi:hypothetical protein
MDGTGTNGLALHLQVIQGFVTSLKDLPIRSESFMQRLESIKDRVLKIDDKVRTINAATPLKASIIVLFLHLCVDSGSLQDDIKNVCRAIENLRKLFLPKPTEANSKALNLVYECNYVARDDNIKYKYPFLISTFRLYLERIRKEMFGKECKNALLQQSDAFLSQFPVFAIMYSLHSKQLDEHVMQSLLFLCKEENGENINIYKVKIREEKLKGNAACKETIALLKSNIKKEKELKRKAIEASLRILKNTWDSSKIDNVLFSTLVRYLLCPQSIFSEEDNKAIQDNLVHVNHLVGLASRHHQLDSKFRIDYPRIMFLSLNPLTQEEVLALYLYRIQHNELRFTFEFYEKSIKKLNQDKYYLIRVHFRFIKTLLAKGEYGHAGSILLMNPHLSNEDVLKFYYEIALNDINYFLGFFNSLKFENYIDRRTVLEQLIKLLADHDEYAQARKVVSLMYIVQQTETLEWLVRLCIEQKPLEYLKVWDDEVNRLEAIFYLFDKLFNKLISIDPIHIIRLLKFPLCTLHIHNKIILYIKTILMSIDEQDEKLVIELKFTAVDYPYKKYNFQNSHCTLDNVFNDAFLEAEKIEVKAKIIEIMRAETYLDVYYGCSKETQRKILEVPFLLFPERKDKLKQVCQFSNLDDESTYKLIKLMFEDYTVFAIKLIKQINSKELRDTIYTELQKALFEIEIFPDDLHKCYLAIPETHQVHFFVRVLCLMVERNYNQIIVFLEQALKSCKLDLIKNEFHAYFNTIDPKKVKDWITLFQEFQKHLCYLRIHQPESIMRSLKIFLKELYINLMCYRTSEDIRCIDIASEDVRSRFRDYKFAYFISLFLKHRDMCELNFVSQMLVKPYRQYLKQESELEIFFKSKMIRTDEERDEAVECFFAKMMSLDPPMCEVVDYHEGLSIITRQTHLPSFKDLYIEVHNFLEMIEKLEISIELPHFSMQSRFNCGQIFRRKTIVPEAISRIIKAMQKHRENVPVIRFCLDILEILRGNKT